MAQETISQTQDQTKKNRQAEVDKIALNREAHLAMFSAAFLKQVGSNQALDYMLVEEWTKDKTSVRWYWELKPGVKDGRENREGAVGTSGSGS